MNDTKLCWTDADLADVEETAYKRGEQDGMQYVLRYLADVFEGVEDTDIWTDVFGEDN